MNFKKHLTEPNLSIANEIFKLLEQVDGSKKLAISSAIFFHIVDELSAGNSDVIRPAISLAYEGWRMAK